MKEINVGEWKLRIGASKQIAFQVVQELENFLNQEWRKVVMEEIKESWWSAKHLGIPSPVIRVDMSPVVRPEVIRESIYEIEVRPGGLGIALFLMPERVRDWKEVLTNCRGFVNIQSSIQDDKLAAEILGNSYYEKLPRRGSGPYWIRTNWRNSEIVELENISLVPIRCDGDKTYLVKLGMAEMLKGELNWKEAFVVKPMIGSRMEGVKIHLPNSLQKELGPAGSSTKSQIIQTISGNVSYIVQKFIPPQREEMGGIKGWTIWRLFFGWEARQYQFVGGLWTWRPNLRVHGATDAVFGLVETL